MGLECELYNYPNNFHVTRFLRFLMKELLRKKLTRTERELLWEILREPVAFLEQKGGKERWINSRG